MKIEKHSKESNSNKKVNFGEIGAIEEKCDESEEDSFVINTSSERQSSKVNIKIGSLENNDLESNQVPLKFKFKSSQKN